MIDALKETNRSDPRLYIYLDPEAEWLYECPDSNPTLHEQCRDNFLACR